MLGHKVAYVWFNSVFVWMSPGVKKYFNLYLSAWNRIFGNRSVLLVSRIFAHKFLFNSAAHKVILKGEVLTCYRLNEGSSLARGGSLSSCLCLPHTCPLLSSSSIKRCAVEACGCKETGTRGLFSVAGGGEKYFFSLSLFTTFLKVCRDRSIHDSPVNEKSVKWAMKDNVW